MWGNNEFSQLGIQGPHSQTPVCMQLKNIQKITAARDYSAALSHAGEVFVWGHNHYGQLGVSEATVKAPLRVAEGCVDIEAGEGAFVMVFEDHVKIAGFREYKEFQRVELPARPVGFAVGDIYAAFFDRFGEVYSIGGVFSDKKKRPFLFAKPPKLVFEKAAPGFFEGKVRMLAGKYSYHIAIIEAKE